MSAEHAIQGVMRRLPKVFPIGMFTIPEMSSVGMSEEEVQAADLLEIPVKISEMETSVDDVSHGNFEPEC